MLTIFALFFVFFSDFNQKDRENSQGHSIASTTPDSVAGVISVSVGDKPLETLLADTEETRQRGLSGRKSLGEDEVMLFVFDTPALYGIWMKDMNFSIDIFWLDQSGKIISLLERVEPATFPKIFTPSVPAKYVLEASAGFAQKNNLKIGGELYFSQNN